jgi:hypothetical protein
VTGEAELLAARATIGDMPAADVDRRLRLLKERRRSRSDLAELGQLAELDRVELERAAYQLARRFHDEGNLAEAARWFGVAAAADYADASFELAKVLDSLAGRLRENPGSWGSRREELDLAERSARWYSIAYAAGHQEAADMLDVLVGCHEPREPCTGSQQVHLTAARTGEVCPLGGLTRVMECRLTIATAHVGTCRPCQQELVDHCGISPVSGNRHSLPVRLRARGPSRV